MPIFCDDGGMVIYMSGYTDNHRNKYKAGAYIVTIAILASMFFGCGAQSSQQSVTDDIGLSDETALADSLSSTEAVAATETMTTVETVFTTVSEIPTIAESLPMATTSGEEKPSIMIPPDTKGNNNTNIVNTSCVAQSGDWHYFSIGDYLYRMKKDGSEQSLIYQGRYILDLQMVGDWLFFLNQGDVYRCRTDGSEIQNLEIRNIYCIYGEWIYYFSDDGDRCLKKKKLDGSEDQLICPFSYDILSSSSNFIIDEGYLYIHGTNPALNATQLYRIDIADGTYSLLKTWNCNGQDFYYKNLIIPDGEWLYYFQYNAGFVRMKKDGSQEEVVRKDTGFKGIQSFNVYNGTVYFTDNRLTTYTDSGHHFLYFQIDGIDNPDTLKEMPQFEYLYINGIVDDWIYYYYTPINSTSLFQCYLYRIRLDGSGNELVVDLTK